MKILNFSLNWVGLMLVLLFSQSAFAQPTQSKQEEDAIRRRIYAFADAYAKLPQTQKRSTVLDFVSEDLTSVNIITRVNGNVNYLNGDYKVFDSYLQKLETTESLKITYKITNIEKILVKNGTAVVVYSVEYEFAKEGSAWSRGTEIVTIALRKVGNMWKILHFTFVGIEDEKFKGTCLCEIFSSGGGDLVAKATVPSGKSYSTDLNNFVFKGAEYADRTIMVNNFEFTWKPTGELYPKGGGSDKFIGTAKTKEDAAIMLMQNVLYVNNCSELKVKRMK